MKSRIKGQLLIEFLLVLIVVIWLIGYGLDLLRRSQLQLVLHHVACELVREEALGGGRGGLEARALRKIRHYLPHLSKKAGWEISLIHVGLSKEIKLHFRYPAYVQFPMGVYQKHHMEVTQRCFFPIG